MRPARRTRSQASSACKHSAGPAVPPQEFCSQCDSKDSLFEAQLMQSLGNLNRIFRSQAQIINHSPQPKTARALVIHSDWIHQHNRRALYFDGRRSALRFPEYTDALVGKRLFDLHDRRSRPQLHIERKSERVKNRCLNQAQSGDWSPASQELARFGTNAFFKPGKTRTPLAAHTRQDVESDGSAKKTLRRRLKAQQVGGLLLEFLNGFRPKF